MRHVLSSAEADTEHTPLVKVQHGPLLSAHVDAGLEYVQVDPSQQLSLHELEPQSQSSPGSTTPLPQSGH